MANQIQSDSKYDNFDYPTISPESKSGHPGHTTPEQDAQVHQLVMHLDAYPIMRLLTLSMITADPIGAGWLHRAFGYFGHGKYTQATQLLPPEQ